MNEEYIRVFKAFADANRIRVLELLCDGEQCACVLLDDMKISQPTLSHHMKILCDSGIVNSRRDGKWNYYSINPDGCEYARRLIKQVEEKKLSLPLRIIVLFSKLRKVVKTAESCTESAVCSCEKYQ